MCAEECLSLERRLNGVSALSPRLVSRPALGFLAVSCMKVFGACFLPRAVVFHSLNARAVSIYLSAGAGYGARL